MEGYLEIWQGLFPHWNKYYFRIHEELLLFGPNKEEIEGRIHLKIAQIISKLDDPISLMIHTGTQTIELRANSINEKVKWFKKLKEVQKQVIDSSHNKELFKMRVELSKVNRFKILDDLNTELWKCHAELEQKLEDVIEKVKNVQILKSIDKLRISIDSFKYKTTQILQYIDEEIRDMKAKDKDKSKFDSDSKRKSSNTYEPDFDIREEDNNGPEDTQFYSFYDEPTKTNGKKPIQEKTFKKISRIPEESRSSSSLSINLNQKKSIYETPRPSKHRFNKSELSISQSCERNRMKYKLFHENKVYLKYSNILSNVESRQSLPARFTPQQKFSVMSTFASAFTSGADLTKITMPIAMNEPLSMLQKACESMIYSDFLNKADDSYDENARMLYITAFIVSGYSLNEYRTKKPFNPLLGQTFEYVDEAKGYEFLAEQVSHHPPISAYFIRSDNYQIFDNTKSKVSFTGNGIKVIPQSKTIIKLQRHSDFYVISKCEISLSNILLGKVSVEVFGEITIKCKEFNTQVVLEFDEESFWKGTSPCRITGYLTNQGKRLYNFEGYWNKELIVQNLVTKEKSVLWKKSHQLLRDYYNFNQLSLQLNNLTSSAYKSLPPTDSRFRPDQRALEFRDIDLACEQKLRLEEKQRKRVGEDQLQKKGYRPLWFKESVLQGQNVYISNERYWDEKIKGIWKQSADIF